MLEPSLYIIQRIRNPSLLYLIKQMVRTRREANFLSHVPKSSIGNPSLQKGGVPAAPSGTATLLRLSPNYQFRPRPLLTVTDFRRPRRSWLDGRGV